MDAYLFPIESAAWEFPLVAALLTVPYIVFCYRKYGSISVLRSLVLFSMVFYLQCALYLVILPLPDPAAVAEKTGPFYNLIPFTSIADFFIKSPFELTHPSTWLRAVRSHYFLEPVFNLFLTLPFGVYLAYYFKSSLKKTIAATFSLSLIFELTQLTGLWGVYPHPYRLFDVNDLITNTLGGVMGFALFQVLFRRFLPKRERIDEKSFERGQTVSYTRRFVAIGVDYIIVSIIATAVSDLTNIKWWYLYAALLLVYFPLLALTLNTPGKALVRIKTAGKGKARIVRYTIRSAGILLFSGFSQLAGDGRFDDFQLYFVLGQALLILLFSADALTSRKKEKRMLYERITGTRNISTTKKKAPKVSPSA
ncbi:teicoplanin resistance protein VanZ [Clostridia bacterium]|nr:teicoplanin resistance protein VanZ [Clostridia bacterium]